MKRVKHVEERPDWQVIAFDQSSPTVRCVFLCSVKHLLGSWDCRKISTYSNKHSRQRKTQDDILVGAKSDVIYERDPLLLQDGQLLSRSVDREANKAIISSGSYRHVRTGSLLKLVMFPHAGTRA
jgi:hypothetical protein